MLVYFDQSARFCVHKHTNIRTVEVVVYEAGTDEKQGIKFAWPNL